MDVLQDVTQIQEEEGGTARAFQRLSSVDVNVVHVGQIHAEDVVASTQQAPQYAFMVRIASTGRVNSHTLELYNMCYLVSHCLTLCACHGPQARIAMPGHYLRLSRADYQLIVHGNNDATLQVALLDCIRHAFCLDEKKHHVKESSEDKLLKLASCFAVEVFEPGKHTDRESSNVRRLTI